MRSSFFVMVFMAVSASCSSGTGPDGGSGGGFAGGSGGGSGGGSVGGGSGGGGGGAGGGSSAAGTVTFDTFAFYKPALVSGPDGVLHLVFSLNTSPSEVRYARCPADCGVGSNWAVAIIGSGQFTGSTRLVVGSDRRVHVLYEVSGTSIPTELQYATCASNCEQAGSWTRVNLASLFGGGWSSPSKGSPMVIDSQNRVSFTVDRSIYASGGLTLATCAADCTTLANWSAGRIRTGGTRTALAARGTTLHQLVDNTTASTNANALSYRTCASNCTQEASWQELSNFVVYDGYQPLAIAATAQGGVRVVYNQGPSDPSQSAAVKAQDNLMLYWACDANCLQVGSWSGLVTGALNDGSEGIAMVEVGGAVVLSVTNSAKVFTRVCEQNCLTASNWTVADVDTAAAMTADYDPFTFTAATCSGSAPLSATWHLEHGVVAIRPDGSAAFAHAVSILRTCAGSSGPVYIPGFGRLVFLP